MHVRSDLIDNPVSIRVLEVIKPKQIEAAVKALEEIERREETVDNQWRMKIERAEYEANLAQRRYEAVDPDNRLVAGTLEKRWNEALVKFEEVSRYVVYYWIERKIITARRLNHGSPYWITIDTQKEKELAQWVKKSTKIQNQSDQHSNTVQ